MVVVFLVLFAVAANSCVVVLVLVLVVVVVVVVAGCATVAYCSYIAGSCCMSCSRASILELANSQAGGSCQMVDSA